MALVTIVAPLILLISANRVQSQSVDCSIVRCVQVHCGPNESLIPGNGVTKCCNSCEKVKDLERKQRSLPEQPVNCAAVSCLRVDPEDCKSYQVFVQADGINTCCNGCRDVDIAAPLNCSLVLCAAVKPEDCKPSETFIQADGENLCCSYCQDYCSLVRCASQTADECKPNEIFEPRDGIRKCCDRCVPDPDYCARVDCAQQTPTECGENEYLEQRDGITVCCDRCVPIDFCSRVRCAPQKPEECTKEEIWQPRDGIKHCCDRCVPNSTAPCSENKKGGGRICKKCPLVSCLYVKREDCGLQEVFVPRDGYCNCCDSCQPKRNQ